MDPESRPPQPPKFLPPAPPPPELVKPAVPHVPLTPMMDFLSRRMEDLEQQLALERERAQSAQSLLQQQEALKGQVEAQLKALSDNIRREKNERESEETKQHARGRIDALEKRLDEMHQSWVSLLRDAMTQRETTHSEVTASQGAIAREQAGLKQELTALQGAIDALSQQMGQWRSETKPLADAAPSLRAFEGQVAQRLDHFMTEVRDRLAAWERHQSLEMDKREERLQAFTHEKATLLRQLEERDHLLRQESIKEKLHRETLLAEQMGELMRRVDALARESAAGREALARVHEHVTTPAPAKDKIIEALEGEKEQLARALRDRVDAFKAHVEERREVERTMGDSLMAVHRELDSAKKELQAMQLKIADAERAGAHHADELASLRRQIDEREERRRALEAERDELAKALLAEADKSRRGVDERAKTDEAWSARTAEMQAKLAAEMDARAQEASTVADLRAQIVTLSDHLARSLQEKDAIASRFGAWDKERADLLRRLEEKEQMIGMLNSTFRKFLK